MSEKHVIRNGVIIGVVVAALVSASFWKKIATLVRWCWSIIASVFSFLSLTTETRVWVLALLGFLAFLTLWRWAGSLIRPNGENDVTSHFAEMTFRGTIWRWCWLAGQIRDLWAYCPNCDLALSYEERHDHSSMERPRDVHRYTFFMCDHCDACRSRIKGDKGYALGLVRREIERRIRTGEWKKELLGEKSGNGVDSV